MTMVALFGAEQVQNLRGFFRGKMADDEGDGLHLLIADEIENLARDPCRRWPAWRPAGRGWG